MTYQFFKKLSLTLSACCFLLLSAHSIAKPAPQFSLPEHATGQTTTLADFSGKVVYLDFWASWCKPCRTSFPWMNQMQAKYEQDGLVVLSINIDSEISNIDKFLSAYPATFMVLHDPEAITAQQYELVGMPSSYLIDKQGVLRKQHTGFFIQQQAQYEAEIKALLNE